jgi:hypothetical protein
MCIHVLCIWNSGVAQSLTKTGAAWRIDTKLRLSLEIKGRSHVVPTTLTANHLHNYASIKNRGGKGR